MTINPSCGWGAKHAHTVPNGRRNWASLSDGPAGVIADRVLDYDVATTSASARMDALDRRLHPRHWIMLPEQLSPAHCRRFLNLSTGQAIRVELPELSGHKTLTPTPEGLLILVHDRIRIRLLNPLTRHLIELPSVTTLLPLEHHHYRREFFNGRLLTWGSFIVTESISFLLCFSGFLGIAKPGDECWKVIPREYGIWWPCSTPLMFLGRLYWVIGNNLMVLETSADPRLEVAAKLCNHVYTDIYYIDCKLKSALPTCLRCSSCLT
uniref:KIB1-4 beta-propeller domain-containing protein n=1 Tax=Aegilops tauschii TaxID=37682 RepID=M8AR71_AEGTA